MRVKTQCTRDCPDSCYMDAEVIKGKLFSVTGGRDNPVTNGMVCPRGAGDVSRVYSEKRVQYPRLRAGNKPGSDFKNATWNQAYDEICMRLKETLQKFGPEKVLLLDYAGNAGLITSQYAMRLWATIGATHTDYAICSLSGHEALKLHYGLSYGVTAEQLPDMKLVILWGHNARVSSMHQWALINKAREKGAKLVVVDPRRSESADQADIWIKPKPGSDVALAYGVANLIISKGFVDIDFINKYAVGYEAYRDEALSWSKERVETTTGVGWDELETLAAQLGENKPSVIFMGIGVQKSSYGAETIRGVSLLPNLVGQHRGFYYTNSRGRFIDFNYLVTQNKELKWRTVSQTDLASHLQSGDFKFVYVTGTNPVVTLPSQRALREGLCRGDVYTVVHDTHMTETCDYADAVLPAPTFLEKEDVSISDCHPHTRFGQRCIEPLGESHTEVSVMREIALRIGVGGSWLMEEPRETLRRALKDSFENGTVDDFLEGKSLRLRERRRDEYQTPSGKVEFASSIAKAAVTPLPLQLPLPDEDSFTLLNSALPHWTHTQFRDVYGDIPSVVWVNRSDAEAKGIIDGDTVILSNMGGEIEVKALVGDKVGRGVLWSPRQIVDSRFRPQNTLASGKPQAIGGGPTFNSTRVQLSKSTER
jgi:anaerobic selenocysteine-containing dehydrogenase